MVNTENTATSKGEVKVNNGVKTYLFAYNALELAGWLYVVKKMFDFYTNEKAYGKIWDHVSRPVISLQIISLLEIVHILSGFVKANVMATTMQLCFRVLHAVGVLSLIPPETRTVGVLMTLCAWSAAEIIRFLVHVLKEFNYVPYFVMWLRYSAFMVLMPLGLMGELLCIMVVQSHLAEQNIGYVKLPYFDVTVGYRHFLLASIPMSIQGIVTIYKRMSQLRRKTLGGEEPKKKK